MKYFIICGVLGCLALTSYAGSSATRLEVRQTAESDAGLTDAGPAPCLKTMQARQKRQAANIALNLKAIKQVLKKGLKNGIDKSRAN